MSTPLPGSRIGPYEIVGPLGAGGMGEVYRARDSRLQRDVAIKILPASFALDAERLQRFEREARILAALDHPQIASIYGVEELDGSRALVLECVEGPTLADRIARGPLAVPDALGIARQIADAVESAHEQGIIHRDLKPANIKVRPDGTVKVLDFGLARVDSPVTSGALDAATVTAVATRHGTILGTAAYMSPEQARGRSVDRRTDIWAFGCILFEMLSGRRAFAGDGATDTISHVLQREPDWTALPGHTPVPVRELIARCLKKDPRIRLRDIGDARLIIDDALAAPAAPAGGRASTHLRVGLPLVAAIALVSAAMSFGLTRWATPTPTDPFQAFDHVVRFVASPAHESSPVISPDGKWVAYLSTARGPTDVWLKSVSGGDAVNLTGSLDVQLQSNDAVGGLDVSPDGSQIAFIAGLVGTPAARMSTYAIPAPLGGPIRRLLSESTGMRWSPDGKQIVYVRTGGLLGDSLVIADADGQNARDLVKPDGPRHIHWARWSPDGKHVYFNSGFPPQNAEQTEIFRVSVAGGAVEPIVTTSRRAVFPLPGPDGRGLFYAANPDSVETNLWWRDLRTQRDHRITFGVGEYTTSSISADGRRLVATVTDFRQTLKRVGVTSEQPVLEPLTEGYAGDLDPCLSPDGTRLVFSSSRSGSRNIWTVSLANLSKPSALTSGAAIDERPQFSPDGTQVAFVSDRGGQRSIWVVSADGGTPRMVTRAQVLDTISWSPDGTRLVYSAPGARLPQLETVHVQNGNKQTVQTVAAASSPAWSPAANVIAYLETTPGRGAFVRYVTGDGRPHSPGPVDKETALNSGSLAWSRDGKRLAGVSLPGSRAGAIWIIEPAAPAPYRKVMDLAPDVIVRGATWTRDNASIIIGESRSTGDIILAERSR